ncbi:MAG TPA: type II secretion system protein [Polyangiaceae bacterium]|nr:type II secretion system protein [Polyangiaceae bacterium]
MSEQRLRRGFTLLEVLVAIAILGLGLTVILGSQVGLFTNAARGEHLTIATNLARCKMGELEVKLLALGYQLTDEKDEGTCCEGEDEHENGYHCAWKVERITLPELPLNGGLDGGMNNLAGDGGSLDLGPLSMLTGSAKPGASGLQLPDKSKPTDLAQALASGPSPMGLAPMMMSMVYPTLKPMLEASIRKVTVTVQYKEGKFARELTITQYVTNPQQGQLLPGVDGGVPGSGSGIPGLGGLGSGATGLGSTPSLSTGLGR